MTVTYAALGGGLLSFALTFGLAPIYRKQLKEDDDWQSIYKSLVAGGGVEFVDPEDAYARRDRIALVDVRLGLKYEKAHAPEARSLPLYTPIQGWGAAAVARRAAFR